MRTLKYILPVLLFLSLTLAGCGNYYFPHVYDGPAKTVYMPDWQNRTNNLELNARIYHSLSRWFQKSKSVNLTKDKAEADLILAGEIVSIVLPSVSWDQNARATEVKVKLSVRYIFKDLQSGDILWEVPKELLTEEYLTGGGSTSTLDNEKKALDQIIDDLSEKIYIGVLEKLRKQNMESK